MKLSRRILATLALAFAGLLAFVTPASADTYEYQIAVQGDFWAYENAYSGNDYGHAVYEDGGDEIYIQDDKKDGMRVAAFWSVPSLNRTGLCVNTGGYMALHECNKSFAEGHRIYIKFAGRCDGAVSSCRYLSQYSNGAATDSTLT
ncbi:MAG: hypothetical protein JWP57_4669 [Spirosoma sp.]|nr:hypothetical protein [Friedmanniella sp.]MDB5244043.1 hypothetical protein [Spirosoma sp.]